MTNQRRRQESRPGAASKTDGPPGSSPTVETAGKEHETHQGESTPGYCVPLGIYVSVTGKLGGSGVRVSEYGDKNLYGGRRKVFWFLSFIGTSPICLPLDHLHKLPTTLEE